MRIAISLILLTSCGGALEPGPDCPIAGQPATVTAQDKLSGPADCGPPFFVGQATAPLDASWSSQARAGACFYTAETYGTLGGSGDARCVYVITARTDVLSVLPPPALCHVTPNDLMNGIALGDCGDGTWACYGEFTVPAEGCIWHDRMCVAVCES